MILVLVLLFYHFTIVGMRARISIVLLIASFLVAGLSRPADASSIATGIQRTCAVATDGAVSCWGYNVPYLGYFSEFPVEVPGITSAVAVTTTGDSACALLSDGAIRCWGYNDHGQLGDGTFVNSETPVPVAGITTAITVEAGYHHYCAVLEDGTIQCWGANNAGQLGDGVLDDSATPVTVNGVTAVAVALDHYYTCALLADGAVQCWGENEVDGITTAVAIAAGWNHACAVLSDGAIRCWGSNSHGQLGNGTFIDSTTPVSVTGITTAVAVTAGNFHTCALLSDGSMRCWGGNAYGQLGDGTTMTSPTPVAVSGITGAVAVAAGNLHTCTVVLDGSIVCWGNNYAGQLGNWSLENYTVPVVTSDVTTFNTSSGSNVTVPLGDGVTTTFSSITQPDTTTLTTSDTGEAPPDGFQLGDPPVYYDVVTTAVFSGPVTVCIDYSNVGFANESEIGLFHLEDGEWVDATVSLDTTENVICAEVDFLSTFAIFEPIPDADGDGVPDSADLCPATPGNVLINAQGCGAEQLIIRICPGPGSFKNRGLYTSCVAHATKKAAAECIIAHK